MRLTLPDRLRRREMATRNDADAPDLTVTFPRVDAEPAPPPHGQPGREPRRAARPATSLLAPPAGERTYRDLPAEQVAAYRRAAAREFFPAPPAAVVTAPMAVLPVNAKVPPRHAARTAAADMPDIAPVCAQKASTDLGAARYAAQALREIDFETVDEARKTEGATYASVRAARGRVTVHDALEKERRRPLGDPGRPAWRPPAVAVRRHGAAVARRLAGLTRPAPGADDLYAEFLRRVSAITGTAGVGDWRAAVAEETMRIARGVTA